MTPNKKVDFIERIDKTLLGLDGLEIVVESDRNCRGNNDEKVEFAKIGKKLIKEIDGKLIMEKYNISPGIKLKEKIHEERVLYLKKLNSIKNRSHN